MAQDVDQIIDLLRAQALAGDPQAMRILLDRVLPSLRTVELPTPLDMPAGTLADQAQAVVKASAESDIAPSQAVQIITALGGVAKIIETTELITLHALKNWRRKMKKLSERIVALESTEATFDQVRVIRFVGLGEEATPKAVRATIGGPGGPGGPEVLRYDGETEAEFFERVEHETRIWSSLGQFMVAMVWP